MTHDDQACPGQSPRRRTLLRGAALAGAAGLGVAACSPATGRDAGPATPTAPVELGAAGDVPVGGARIYRESKVVVAQPEQGEYRAFSAVCTHGGCVLSAVTGLEADCGCHGSRFDATTGEVLRAPATARLPEVPVRVEGGKLIAGPDA
ncbi:Rieske (2Fe-2S) protein [Streptomyces gobiensis]|uniref:Rieske (2Fe-2S) protein n=1 Tax=Streptomyces gobiensis TaxID=2875706 RepID=UPI001E3A0AD0|nr:Rieske (2Fe-2S) protein [Streptomyces gobiensis]UGY90738.1 Rieske (2Fe-2S) protein [Streptomyces gobiensis]